jgi:hypothetical protein
MAADIYRGTLSPAGDVSISRLDTAGWRGIAYAAGPAVIFLLVMTYLFEPEFYLKWVIEPHGREYQIVEILTFATALSASILLAVWIRRAYPSAGQSDRIGIATVAVIALAAFFFAGEEISWGQTYFGWGTPENHLAGETNLHNTPIPVQSLGSAFLVVVFFVLPLVWALGLRRPAGLASAIAEGPVILCLAFAFLWQETKSLYRSLHEDYAERTTYIEFFEQINEHKELLIAVTLLLYAIFRFRHRFTERLSVSFPAAQA